MELKQCQAELDHVKNLLSEVRCDKQQLEETVRKLREGIATSSSSFRHDAPSDDEEDSDAAYRRTISPVVDRLTEEIFDMLPKSTEITPRVRFSICLMFVINGK